MKENKRKKWERENNEWKNERREGIFLQFTNLMLMVIFNRMSLDLDESVIEIGIGKGKEWI